MIERGGLFQYPIITVNVDKEFRWEHSVTDLLFEMTAKFGTPYFSNFINTEFKKSDIRSMCCRLRLDLRQLERNSSGGLFGSGSKTGSIGVVTINLPRIGYLSKTKEEFYNRLSRLMELASESLETKRLFLDKMFAMGMYPYAREYLKTLNNHFSTIGLVGMHECCLNFLKKGIDTEQGQKFAIEILQFMKNKLKNFQEKTGHLYNLEATPAESTCYRLAKHDKRKFPLIRTSGEKSGIPYYTNSSNLPVNYTNDLWKAIKHQEPIQANYTGGTVFHMFNDGNIKDVQKTKALIKNVLTNSTLPYVTYSNTLKICEKHGLLNYDGNTICPFCKEEVIRTYNKKIEDLNQKRKELIENEH